ncbi:MAG: DUF3592 domain-containing protein [Bacteroidota bacterium]
MTGKKNSFGALLIVGLVFIPAGYFSGFRIGKSILQRAKASQAWPNADGVIDKSEVGSKRSGGSKHYFPIIKYSYAVNGITYKGDEIRVGSRNTSASYRSFA